MASSRVDVAAYIEADGLHATLYRSRRRSLSIQLLPDRGLIMRAPYGVSTAALCDFLQRRRSWIEVQRGRLEGLAAAEREPRWVEGERLPFLGSELVLRLESGRAASARIEGAYLAVRVPSLSEAEAIRNAVWRLYAREAAKSFPAYLDECLDHPAAIGLPRPELRVRSMRSRWGSCDTARRIVTLNTSLMRRSPELLRYVIMHELSHLRFRYHDEAFYALLGRLCPDWERRRAQLSAVRP